LDGSVPSRSAPDVDRQAEWYQNAEQIALGTSGSTLGTTVPVTAVAEAPIGAEAGPDTRGEEGPP